VCENCEYAAISLYISRTVQASARVTTETTECEYKVTVHQRVSFSVTLNDP